MCSVAYRLGLDPKLLVQILNMSSGRCWSSDSYNPVPGVMEGVPSANNYQGGYGTTLMAKARVLTAFSAPDLYSHLFHASSFFLFPIALTVCTQVSQLDVSLHCPDNEAHSDAWDEC